MKELAFVIPLYNDRDYLQPCLKSLEAVLKDVEFEYEVIVVDNYSTDGSYEIALTFPFKVLRCEGNKPSIVRNYGAVRAEAEFIVFIDSDCIVNSHWLSLIREGFKDSKVAAYGGPHLAPKNDAWIVNNWYPRKFKEKKNIYAKLPGGNFALRSSVFFKLGMFNETLISAEDDELSKRVIQAGHKSVLDSEAAIIHLGYPKTFLSLFKKQVWHGATQVAAHGLFGDKMTLATLVWLITVLLFPVGLYFKGFMLLTIISFLSIPALFTYNRLKSHKKMKLSIVPKSYLISFAFISGRAIGLIKEISKLLVK